MEVTPEIISKIHQQYFPRINFTDIPHKKVLITFSSTQAAGKTTLARFVETEFKMMRICNDDVRDLVHELFPELSVSEVNAVMMTYQKYLIVELLKLPNGYILVDASIDRSYDMVKEFCIRANLPLKIISLETNKEILKDRWLGRKVDGYSPFSWFNNCTEEEILKMLDRSQLEHDELQSRITPNLIVNTDTPVDLEKFRVDVQNILSADE